MAARIDMGGRARSGEGSETLSQSAAPHNRLWQRLSFKIKRFQSARDGPKWSSAMRVLSAICRLSAPVAMCIFASNFAVGETTTVGTVDKVQAQVNATQVGQTRALAINSDVYFRDTCHSTEGARLQATLKDGTQLTLGENATLVVDEFIYDPFMSRGALSLRVIKGAFLFVGGRIEGVAGAKVQIRTPFAAIGVRGTTVWGGPIDNGYGIVVLSGEVTVTARKGTVTLRQGQGTMLIGNRKPQRAAAWPAGRMKRAVASITFGNPPARP
jgi:FecR protein